MMFDHMPTVVLHPQFVDEVKNHPDLNTTEAIKKVCPWKGTGARAGTEN